MFHDDSDRLVYIRALKDGCTKHGVSISAYSLMTNHVHLIAVPESEKSISLMLHDAHTDYSTYFNAKYGFVGHLWQGRPDFSVDIPRLFNSGSDPELPVSSKGDYLHSGSHEDVRKGNSRGPVLPGRRGR